MPDPILYGKAMGAAAVASATLLLAMAAVRAGSKTWLNSTCVIGIGIGLVVGYVVLSLSVAWPPVSALDRLLTIVAPAVLGVELIAGFDRVSRWFAWMMRFGLAAMIPPVLLHGSVYLSGSDDDWRLWQVVSALALCSVLLASLWSLLSLLSARSPGASIPLALCMTTLCAGLAVMMAGYIKGGGAALPWASALAAMTICVGLIGKRLGADTNPGTPVLLAMGVVGLFGVLFIGRFFGDISTGYALTMLLAPLLCWVTEIPWLRHRNPWLVGSLRLVLVAIPVSMVLGLAKGDFDREMAPLIAMEKSAQPLDRTRVWQSVSMPVVLAASNGPADQPAN